MIPRRPKDLGAVRAREIQQRDGDTCRPCGTTLTFETLEGGRWFPIGGDYILICGMCAAAEQRRDLGMSRSREQPGAVVCHGRTGARCGSWLC
jgi:hypothetical protein